MKHLVPVVESRIDAALFRACSNAPSWPSFPPKHSHVLVLWPGGSMLARMRALRFSKYEGLGNDFIVVDADEIGVSSRDTNLMKALCDRHRGIGADGVLVVAIKNAQPSMHIFNADGTEPEMCGNGLRCVALYLVRNELVRGHEVSIDTPAGPHRCVVAADAQSVAVEMRAASFDASLSPNHTFTFGGRSFAARALSVGNPHLVLFDGWRPEERAALGAAIEKDARFPRGVNVGFARVEGESLALSVWERGVGLTEACGTGAVAAAAAAVEHGLLPRDRGIRVSLPGGDVQVHVGDTGDALQMSGPARHVFDGVTTPANTA